jgi:hypothetical protein
MWRGEEWRGEERRGKERRGNANDWFVESSIYYKFYNGWF